MVNSGNNKGQSGRVLVINIADNKAIVEGVNLIAKHTKPNADNPKGGIIKQEAAVHLSNLMLIDKAGSPTRTGLKIDDNTGKTYRLSLEFINLLEIESSGSKF